MMDASEVERIHPALAAGLGSMAGLAALLRSRVRLTWRNALSAAMYNGLSAMAAAWLLEDRLHATPQVMAGVCVMCGIGGTSVVDVLVAGVRVKLGADKN